MRQTLSRGMVAAAAATGILSLCGGAAFADTSADGVTKGSPGALSGNTVQAPVEVPVNACGNSVDVIAALNPSFGNSCANEADADGGDGGEDRSRGDEDTSYGDEDTSYGDGGYGDDDGYGDTPPTKPPHTPPTKPPHTPPPGGHQSTPPATPPGDHQTPPPPPGDQEQPPSLPETGAADLLGAAGASAALIVSGVVLYRRGRAASHR